MSPASLPPDLQRLVHVLRRELPRMLRHAERLAVPIPSYAAPQARMRERERRQRPTRWRPLRPPESHPPR